MGLVSKEFKGEYELMAAVLEEAESGIENGIERMLKGKEPKKEFYEDVDCVRSNSNGSLYSFVNVCLHLGINADNYRKRLNEVVARALKGGDAKKAKIVGLHKILATIRFERDITEPVISYSEKTPTYRPSP